jgi:hypothetical protein
LYFWLLLPEESGEWAGNRGQGDQMSFRKCHPKRAKTKDRCYDFLNIFAEKISEKLAFLTQNKAKF